MIFVFDIIVAPDGLKGKTWVRKITWLQVPPILEMRISF